MQCPKCHQRVVEGAKRCPACGASVKKTFLGWLVRLLIPANVMQQIQERASASPASLPEAEEGEFYLVVDSVSPHSGNNVMVQGRFSGNADLRKGDRVVVTLKDKTLKTCEVVGITRLGDIIGIDAFANFAGLVLGGVRAEDIGVGDVVKKV